MSCPHPVARSLSAGACPLCPEPEDDGPGHDLGAWAQAELRRLEAHRCRAGLSAFVRQSWSVLEPTTELKWNWHHALICLHLQEMFFDWQRAQREPEFRQRACNAIFNVPPGSLKSRLIAVCFPVWAWLHEPGFRVICLSVTKDAVYRDARFSRQLITSPWYQETFRPGWEIRDDQDAVSDYGNTAGGFRLSKPSGSEIVGLRGDALLVDDPNNPLESHSEKARRQVNLLWNTNTFNRVNSMVTSLRIIVQQRTHEEDLTGYVLAQSQKPGGIRWVHVRIPAEFEPDHRCETVFGRDPREEPGESFHPDLYPPEVIAAEKIRFGPYDSAGQLQQRPGPIEGGLFKKAWFREIARERLPKMDEVVLSLDANAKKTLTGSRAALVAVGRASAERYVLDAWAERVELPEICQAIRDMFARCLTLGCRPTKIVIEMRALGPAVIQTMRDELRSMNLEIVETEPGDDKMSRAKAVVPVVAAGNVGLLLGALWAEAFLHEVCVFPNGATDDFVDSLSQALTHLAGDESNARYVSRPGGIWSL